MRPISIYRPVLPLLALLALALPLAGCKREPPSAAALRFQLERLSGASFRRDSHVRLGRVALALVRPILRWVDDGDPDVRKARNILSNIRRVEVATYEVVSPPDLARLDRVSDRLERRLADGGWTMMLHEREADERVWIFYREDDAGTIRNLYLVDLDERELTVVDLAGRLDQMLAEALAGEPDALVEALAPAA